VGTGQSSKVGFNAISVSLRRERKDRSAIFGGEKWGVGAVRLAPRAQGNTGRKPGCPSYPVKTQQEVQALVERESKGLKISSEPWIRQAA